jgi:hypothetical protein
MGTLLLISLGCTLATSLVFVPALLGAGSLAKPRALEARIGMQHKE